MPNTTQSHQPIPVPLRGKDTSDIVSHLIPHLEKMRSGKIKKELVRIVKDTCERNHFKPQIVRSLLYKVETLVHANEHELRPAVIAFALWLDKLVPIDSHKNKGWNGGGAFHSQAPSLRPVDEFDSTPRGIIDCLHLDYKLNEFQATIRGAKALILVGPAYTLHNYNQVRRVAAGFEDDRIGALSVWIDCGSVHGKIQWISGMHDQISIRYPDGTFSVFPSVFAVLPYLMGAGNQSGTLQTILDSQEKLAGEGGGVVEQPRQQRSLISELTGLPDEEIPWSSMEEEEQGEGEQGEEQGEQGEQGEGELSYDSNAIDSEIILDDTTNSDNSADSDT